MPVARYRPRQVPEERGVQFGAAACAGGLGSGGLRRRGRDIRPRSIGWPSLGRPEVRRIVAAAAEDEAQDRARRLGLQPGLTVQEIGYDDDVDSALRAGIEGAVGSELVDDDYDDVVDVVIMWWRDDDGDLADGLLDAIGPLADHGVVWLMTPKPGRDGHIEAEDIADAAPTAGLQQTSTISAGSHWQGTRLVAPRAKR